MNTIPTIETRYKGYRFRSRLEARWAVFFDALGIEWEYEKEGYDLSEAGWYLPDFWLPQVEMWAEVKPKHADPDAWYKLYALVKVTHKSALMLEGLPSTHNYWGYEYSDWLGDEMPVLMDWRLQESHRYWKTEGRFYSNTGALPLVIEPATRGHEIDCLCDDCDLDEAALAARSARFEHGEHGL